MPNISDVIEQFILESLKDEGNLLISRGGLAGRFDCSPSQINYVLATRFTLDAGYYISSRRGGGGYIEIVKLAEDRGDYLNSLVKKSIGEETGFNRAVQILGKLRSDGIITERERAIMEAALDRPLDDAIRAKILKNMIILLLKEER